MSEPAQRFSLAKLWLPSVVFGLFAVYGYLANRPALETKRPETTGINAGVVAEIEQTSEESQPKEEARVLPIRTWEDPLGPAYEALYVNRGPKATAIEPSSDAPSNDGSEAGTAPDEEANDGSQTGVVVPSPIGDWISDLEPEHEVLIVPVFMTGGQTAEAQEKRRRVRYAVISALTTGGYRSTFGSEIKYHCPDIVDDANASMMDTYVGIEAFIPDIIDRFYDQDDFTRFMAVVVCWLDVSRLGEYPLQTTHRLLRDLHVEQFKNCQVRMIGPSNSDGWVRMAKEAWGMTSDAAKAAQDAVDRTEGGQDSETQWFGEFVKQDGTGSSNQSEDSDAQPTPVQMYSSRATLPENRLKSNTDEIIEKDSVETLITSLLSWPNEDTTGDSTEQGGTAQASTQGESTTSKPPDSHSDRKSTGKQIGLQVIRTIGNDEHLAIALKRELELRDAWPRKSDWPLNYESNESIVLVTERDTVYGRSMPFVFARQLRQNWALELIPFATGKSSGSTMIGGKKALQLKFRLADETAEREGDVIFSLNFVRGDRRIAESTLTVDRKTYRVSGYQPPESQKAEETPQRSDEYADARGLWEVKVERNGGQYNGKLHIPRYNPSATASEEESALVGTWELPASLAVFKYLRGIDGNIASGKEDQRRSQTGAPNQPLTDLAGGFEPHGNAQLDYLRRMESELVELHRRQMNRGGKGILAIGVVGSDVFDKLLIMRALSQRFPHIWFFTTALDANYARPSEIAYTRNLLIASHFGLQLHPSLQRGVPPFRDNYQTSDFLSMLLAMNDPRVESALGATSRQNIWGKPGVETADALEPLVFEISSDGPYQLTRTSPRQTIPTSPVVDVPPRGHDSTTSYGRATPSLSEAIHPPSPRDIPRWTYGRVIWLLAITVAAVALFALSITAVKQVVWATMVAVYRVGLAPLVLVAQLWKMMRAFPYCWGSSSDSERRTVPDFVANWTWRGWCRETVDRLPRVFQWATVAGIVLVMALFVLMINDHRAPDGEPLEWFRGISVWPATLIRLGAAIASVAMIWKGMMLFAKSDAQLATNLLRIDESDPLNPTGWRIQDWFGRAVRRCRRRRRVHEAWVPNLARMCGDLLGMILVSDRTVRGTGVKPLVAQHLRKGRWWCRVIRFTTLGAVFTLFAYALFAFTNDWPNSPHRGQQSQSVSQQVLAFSVVGMIAVVFFVVDATHLCQRFVKAFQTQRYDWPGADLVKAASHRPCDDEDDLSDWLSMKLIAQRSQQVGKLLYYPCVVIFLMALARLYVFDRWNIPIPLIIILSLLFGALVIHTLVLRREADRARQAVLQRLREKLTQIISAASPKRREIRREQLTMLIEDIDGLEQGAFRALTEDYLVRALAIPFGGTGGLLLLDQLLG